jgi:hypothetical protein
MGSEPLDEQLTYLLAFVDCLPWLSGATLEFWLEQFVVAVRDVGEPRRAVLVRRLWDVVSGEMGGENGFRAVEWWVNGGRNRVISRL